MKTRNIAASTVLVLALLFTGNCNTHVLGQSAASSNATLVSGQPTAATIELTTENSILKAQLDEMRSHDSDLLTTVLWALTGVITVVVLVTGFAAFINLKVYERDKIAIEKELRSTIVDAISIAKHQALSEISKNVDSHPSMIAADLKREMTSLRTDVIEAQRELEKMAADSWTARGVLGNSFSCHVRMLEMSANLRNDFYFGLDLESLIQDISNGAIPTITKISDLANVLDTAPELVTRPHATTIEVLKSKLVDVTNGSAKGSK